MSEQRIPSERTMLISIWWSVWLFGLAPLSVLALIAYLIADSKERDSTPGAVIQQIRIAGTAALLGAEHLSHQGPPR